MKKAAFISTALAVLSLTACNSGKDRNGTDNPPPYHNEKSTGNELMTTTGNSYAPADHTATTHELDSVKVKPRNKLIK